jgi:hypothetical protein
MTPFQWVTLSGLAGVALGELVGLLRQPRLFSTRTFRLLVWVAAAVAIADPDLLQQVAPVVGIGRAADVVLYTFALGSLMTSFYFYARFVRLQRQITELARHLALQQARRGSDDGESSGG